MGRKITTSAALLLVAVAGLTGCGARLPASRAATPVTTDAPLGLPRTSTAPWSTLALAADPRLVTGSIEADVASSDITPAVLNPRPRLPIKLTDVQGTRVTVGSARRILALDIYGTLAATVQGLGLGGNLVGRDTSTGFPGARHLPLVTRDGHQLDAEAILALHPTVLITDTTLGPFDVVEQVRDSGVPVVIVDSERSIGTEDALTTTVANALGVPAAGRALIARQDAALAAEKARIAEVAPTDPAKKVRAAFLYARGQSSVFYLFGHGSGADSLIDALGADDVATDHHIEGFQPLTAEALAASQPDVLLMMTRGLQSVGGVDGVEKLPGVAETPAGAHRRIIAMDDYQILSFGPNTPEVLDALARALYAPASAA